MIIESLRHRGSYAFPDEIAIDFGALPPLIAVSGPNGAGKTTLCDLPAAALYLTMPFRPGALARNFQTSGYIELVWRLDDQRRYRSHVLVDPKTGRTEASLFDAATGINVAGPGVKEYKRVVEGLLGPIEMFLASAYASQRGSGAFIGLPRAERKALLVELLGLQVFPRYEEEAKKATAGAERDVAALRSRIVTLQERVAGRAGIERQVADATVSIGAAEVKQHEARAEHQRLAMSRDAAKARADQLPPLRERWRRLDQQLTALAARLEGLERRRTEQQALVGRSDVILRAVARSTAIAAELASMERVAQDVTRLEREIAQDAAAGAELRTRLAGIDALLAAATTVRAAAARTEEIGTRLTAVQGLIDQARAQEDAAREAATARTALEREIAQADKDLARVTRTAGILETVPCGAKAPYDGCDFLKEGTTAKGQVATTSAALATLRARLDATGLPAVAVTSSSLVDERRRLEAEREQLRPHAGRAEQLGAASALQGELQDRARDIGASVDAKRARAAELRATIASRPALERERAELAGDVTAAAALQAAEGALREIDGAVDGLRTDMATLTAERAEVLATSEALGQADAERAKAQQELDAVDVGLRAMENDRLKLERELGVLNGQLTAIDAADVEIGDCQAKIPPAEVELRDWVLLTRAFGKNGIPALLIDQALPEIGTTATDLLRECYGEEVFSIALTTQRESADGARQLETLDIVVTRGQEVVDAGVLSGGEAVLVSEALAIAIALYNASRSGRRLQTLWRDEVAAPLDTDRAPAYVKMLRRAAVLGHFKHVVFVSHRPSCLDLADAQFEVRNGAVRAQ